MGETDFHIRRAEGLNDYLACVDLQKKVWGYTDMEDLAAQPMLMIGDRFGGCVLVAQDSAGEFVGFSFAMPGWKAGKRLFWWSHMTAVVASYRNRELGLALKLRQRDEALAAGIDLIEWTFDPMQSLNAHFNLNKLGVIVREYEENVYGYTSSPLHRGLPTDRVVAEWHLKEERPPERDRAQCIRIEIPANLDELKRTDMESALRWQERVRIACQQHFREGYAITAFEKPFYLLTRYG